MLPQPLLPPIAVLDANVLYGEPLRALLLALSTVGLFQARWSADILGEWASALQKGKVPLAAEALALMADQMNRQHPQGLVTDYQELIPDLTLPDDNDRHVLAAAIRAQAQVIVTFNLKDFPPSRLKRHNVLALPPDQLIRPWVLAAPQAVCQAIRTLRLQQEPAPTPQDLLEIYRRERLTRTVKALSTYADLL